jgi:hypothetical protein
VTPPARSGAASFELRRFEAAPVTGAIVVLEVEGRFRQSTRFGRQPVLVIEPGDERRRIELQPVRTQSDGPRWTASYAVPAEALTAGARLALGIRGTLLELPAPDEPDDGERLTALARESNRLRRQLETAEAGAAAARDEAAAATADRDAAVTTAREEAESAAAERISALELEVNEAHRLAAADAETARTAAEQRTTELEESLRAAEQRAADAETRVTAAGARGGEAEVRATAAQARVVELEESLRVAEAAVAEAQEQATAEIDAPLTSEMASVIDAEARASDAERELRIAREGIAVLRAELAEERERSQATVAELEAVRSRADALRNAAAAEGLWPESSTTAAPPPHAGDDARDEDATRVVSPRDEEATRVVSSRDEDETRVLRPAFGADEDDETQAFSAADEADATAQRPDRPLERHGVPHAPAHARTGGVWIGRWVAIAALILFAIVLIALLFGL